MIKYCGSMKVNIFLKSESRFINIATARPYTQEIKNSKNGGLPCKQFYLENNFNISLRKGILINDMSNYKFATDQIIRITSLKLNFSLLKIKRFSFENICNSLNSITFVTNYEYNFNVSTDQTIRKLFPNYGLRVTWQCV